MKSNHLEFDGFTFFADCTVVGSFIQTNFENHPKLWWKDLISVVSPYGNVRNIINTGYYSGIQNKNIGYPVLSKPLKSGSIKSVFLSECNTVCWFMEWNKMFNPF